MDRELIKKAGIPINVIIELGLIRKRNKCAKCGNKIDVENYNIQLCKKCRLKYLDNYTGVYLKK